jgi:uncharacterized membrane protein
MTYADWSALGLFALIWLFYEPILKHVSRRTGAITLDMPPVRAAWMRAMTRREVRLLDSQLLGHAINSASFFASANLILIAAVAGALFGGGIDLGPVKDFGAALGSSKQLEAKLGLVTVCLSRGFLAFIWSIRQLNYCLALLGAAPEGADEARSGAFADAAAEVLNPALSEFSHGVRAYYFALAAGAWLFGPVPLAVATLGAFALLGWRQARSPAARGIRRTRELLEQENSRQGE